MGSSGFGSGKERSDVPYSRAEEDHAQETPKVKGFEVWESLVPDEIDSRISLSNFPMKPGFPHYSSWWSRDRSTGNGKV
jgi:hypothetical protein